MAADPPVGHYALGTIRFKDLGPAFKQLEEQRLLLGPEVVGFASCRTIRDAERRLESGTHEPP
jgi:hypothetical protein